VLLRSVILRGTLLLYADKSRVAIGGPDSLIPNVSHPNVLWRPKLKSGKPRVAYIVGGVDGGEGALEAAHLLAAGVGLALAEVSAEQVVVPILHRGRPVVLGSKQVRIVAEERAFAVEEAVGVVGVASKVEVCRITARFGVAWGRSVLSLCGAGSGVQELSSPASISSNDGNRSAIVDVKFR
jgi:hypothetical protein